MEATSEPVFQTSTQPFQLSFGGFFRSLGRSVPNFWVLGLAFVGIAFELIALSGIEHSIWTRAPRIVVFCVCFTITFWATVALLFNRAAKWLLTKRAQTVGFQIQFITLFWILGIVTCAMLYATSWGIFLQTSRFASWEVLRFSIYNTQGLWDYITEAEPHQMVYGLVTCAAVFGVMFFLVKPFGQVRHRDADEPIFFNKLWLCLIVIMVISFRVVASDPNKTRTYCQMIGVTQSLNPVLTFAVSVYSSVNYSSIEATINESDLTPLSDQWQPVVNPEVANKEFRSARFAPATGERRNRLPSIIMIQVESLRNDVIHRRHQGIEVMPNVNRLASGGLVWNNAYSQATHSDYADPCIVSSLYPLRSINHHYYTKDDPWPKQLSYDCLKKVGYKTATISSQNEMWGNMAYFLESPNLDVFYHPETSNEKQFAEASARDIGFYRQLKAGNLKAGKFPDSHTADQAIGWIEKASEGDQPFLLNMNLQSSHFPYVMAEDIERPFQPCELARDVFFTWYDPIHTESVRNAYYNSLHEIDRQIGRMVAKLEELDLLNDVILVVVGENGEAFHENNQVCHAKQPYNAAIKIATVMFGPGWFSPGNEDYPIEHVDLLPTIFNRIGLESHPNFQGIDALSPTRPELKDRFVYSHVCSPISQAETVQWAGRWKYMWDHLNPGGELFDLKNDPGENENLVDQHKELAMVLHQHLTKWRSDQLAWYHYPAYYTKFYPPKPPKMDVKTKKSIEKFLDF